MKEGFNIKTSILLSILLMMCFNMISCEPSEEFKEGQKYLEEQKKKDKQISNDFKIDKAIAERRAEFENELKIVRIDLVDDDMQIVLKNISNKKIKKVKLFFIYDTTNEHIKKMMDSGVEYTLNINPNDTATAIFNMRVSRRGSASIIKDNYDVYVLDILYEGSTEYEIDALREKMKKELNQ